MLTVQLEHDTVAPLEMATEFRIISVELVPTDPSMTAVASSLLYARKNVAVPVFPAVADPIALAVLAPPELAEKAVLPRVSVAKRVFPLRAASGVAGWVPV
jgi:hypothetical protein